MHLEVCASAGSVQWSVMGKMKWPANYTQYFVFGVQLPPALQSHAEGLLIISSPSVDTQFAGVAAKIPWYSMR